MPDNSTHLLTTREVADRLRVSARTVERLIHRGDLRALRIGGQLRVAPLDLQLYLEHVATEAS